MTITFVLERSIERLSVADTKDPEAYIAKMLEDGRKIGYIPLGQNKVVMFGALKNVSWE